MRQPSAAFKSICLSGALLLASVGGAGCGSTTDPDPGTLSLSLTPAEGTAAQGSSLTVIATATRTGGDAGQVAIQVEDVPQGVAVSIANPTVLGASTARTLTFTPTLIAPGSYPITVRATATGAPPSIATFALTVTELGSYGLAVTPPTITTPQGGTSTAVIAIQRTFFTEAVTLSFENIPGGMTATVSPSTTSGSSTIATLGANPGMALGSYPLTLRGTSPFMADRTLELPVTVITPGPGFFLSISPTSLTLTRGTTGTATITVHRTEFTDPVNLVVGEPARMSVTANPSTITGTSSVLTVVVESNALTGVYNLGISGHATGMPQHLIILPLTVTP